MQFRPLVALLASCCLFTSQALAEIGGVGGSLGGVGASHGEGSASNDSGPKGKKRQARLEMLEKAAPVVTDKEESDDEEQASDDDDSPSLDQADNKQSKPKRILEIRFTSDNMRFRNQLRSVLKNQERRTSYDVISFYSINNAKSGNTQTKHAERDAQRRAADVMREMTQYGIPSSSIRTSVKALDIFPKGPLVQIWAKKNDS